MGEKGNWAPGSAASEVMGKTGATGLGSATDGKEMISSGGKGLETANGLGSASEIKGSGSPTDGKGMVPGTGGTSPGGDGRSAGLPPLGGVLRRRDGEDAPDSGPAS